MKTKRIISIAIALLMMLAIAVPAFAEATYAVNLDVNSTIPTGSEFTVTVNIVTPEISNGVGFILTYDAEKLEYKGFECKEAPAANSNVTDLGNGRLELVSSMDSKQYNGDAWIELTFTASEDEADAVEFSTEYSEDVAFMDSGASVVEEGDIDFGTATIKLVDAHTAPTFAVAIDGDGVVGKELSANISEYSDNWGLEPEYAYSWKLDGEEVSTEETYTPDADAIGKKATVTVVATVDAEENATSDAVTSAEVEIIADETAQASVKDVKLNPEQPKAGTPVTVEYTFVPSVNGGEDESEIEWYNAAQPKENEEPAELAGKVSEDKKTYTPDAKDYENGVILGVTVTPKGSNDVETGEPVPFEAKEPVAKAKKKSTTSGLTGPSLASGKQESSNNGNGNGNGNNGALDTDKFILTIDQKEASVWGVTKTSDVAPLIKNERTMLPIRFVAENLGFTVGWDEATKTVTITKGDKVITLVIDSDKATVNDAEVALDSPAYIDVAASRTMVPLRFIAENLDYTVDWIDTLRQVIITK